METGCVCKGGKGLLYGALAKAQGSYKKLVPNEDSASGPYANLDAIKEAVRESLSKNGLGFYQHIKLLDEGSGAALLETIIGHESGQEIESTARVFSGATDRESFNTIERHKRIHAMMLLGIAPSQNDPDAVDDNGDEQGENMAIEAIKNPKKFSKVGKTDVIDKKDYDQLMIELNDNMVLTQQIQDAYNVTTLQDLPARQFQYAMAEIRRIKRNLANFHAKNA